MKNCEKGFTLLELLICVTMVSIVVVFLFKILNNVQSEEKNNGYVKANQVNRNRIMKDVGLEINKHKVCGLDFWGEGYIVIDFCQSDDSLSLSSSSNGFSAQINGTTYNYDMKDSTATYGTPVVTSTKFNGSDYKTLKIPVSKKGLKKSTIDDIEFTFRYYSSE